MCAGSTGGRRSMTGTGCSSSSSAPVQTRTLALVAGLDIEPRRVLNCGCGTGALLRSLPGQLPGAALAGVDAAAGMIRVARQAGVPAGLLQATAGELPFAAPRSGW